ncbi:MAG: hypothetical protein KDI30_04170, partial [Pseudomonadales bacterium]|nr:hypothetical protein [Pseudomonadales bacterium]
MTEVAASIKLHSVYPWLESFWAQFESQRQQGRLHHALLLSGPDGCGKRDLAFSFVSRLLCDEPAGSSACGACKSCLLLLSGTHPGFLGVF